MTLSRNIDYSEFLCFFERIIIIYLLDTSEYVKKKLEMTEWQLIVYLKLIKVWLADDSWF